MEQIAKQRHWSWNGHYVQESAGQMWILGHLKHLLRQPYICKYKYKYKYKYNLRQDKLRPCVLAYEKWEANLWAGQDSGSGVDPGG